MCHNIQNVFSSLFVIVLFHTLAKFSRIIFSNQRSFFLTLHIYKKNYYSISYFCSKNFKKKSDSCLQFFFHNIFVSVTKLHDNTHRLSVQLALKHKPECIHQKYVSVSWQKGTHFQRLFVITFHKIAVLSQVCIISSMTKICLNKIKFIVINIHLNET